MEQLDNFFTLTFDRVLAAVEDAGHRTTGLCYPLNSLENRVYDLELEDGTRRVAKFYRPGRWSADTIGDEHRFLELLAREEIPVCAPVPFADGATLRATADGILFALFPRVGGRAPDDLGVVELEQLGRLLGRIHNIGARMSAGHRPQLTPLVYGTQSLAIIMERGQLSPSTEQRYRAVAEEIVAVAEVRFAAAKLSLIHADFHRGNLLSRGVGQWLALDFDDCAVGPAAQDLWLILPGRPSECRDEVAALVRGYEQFRAFDESSLVLIEVLRALRYIRYAGWIASRWQDPSFRRAFPEWGSERYWEEQVADLHEQLRLVG